MADVLCFLGATAVVFLAFAVLIMVVPEQSALALVRTCFLRACSFAAELLKQDPEAVSLFGFFVGLVLVIMTRSSCQLPRQQWKPTHHTGARRRLGPLDLKIPRPGRSSQTLQY
jgi:preprotein translocase subunit Sec61beta